MTQVVSRAEKSTIVRAYVAPPPVRAAFWTLERLAPALGARWAERAWFRIPRSNSSNRRAPGGAAATVPGLAAGAPFAVDVNGTRIVGETWGEGPPVYLLHGWAGHRRQFAGLVEPLVANGHRVVAFDAPSHGESGPSRLGPESASVPDFAAALVEVVRLHGPAHAIVAHSMGATAAAAALCDGLRARRLVMIAPMASIRAYAEQFAGWLGFGERVLRRMVVRAERRVGAPLRHFDVPEFGRAIAMPPTLILHDRLDPTIPVSDGAAIAAAWPTAQLRVTSGLGHRRILRDADVLTQVVAFVTS